MDFTLFLFHTKPLLFRMLQCPFMLVVEFTTRVTKLKKYERFLNSNDQEAKKQCSQHFKN